MKRLLCSVLVMAFVFGMLPICGNAAEGEVLHFEDGSYAVIQTLNSGTRAAGSVTGNKTYTYYNSDDVMEWKVVLSGTFTYTGSSSTCTDSSISINISNSAWYVISQGAGKSGNTANASATIGKTLLGVTVARVPVNLTLTCDANGNLS